MNHGFGGAAPSPNPAALLNAIVAWVEQGKAPDRLFGEQRDKSGKLIRARPFFPYPQFARYKGTGSTDEATNYIAAQREK